jgi:hypothetical protein
MTDLDRLHTLVSDYGKGYDYVVFREDDAVYMFDMNKAAGIPAVFNDSELESTVAHLVGFGKLVRIVCSVNSAGSYTLPEDIVDEDY